MSHYEQQESTQPVGAIASAIPGTAAVFALDDRSLAAEQYRSLAVQVGERVPEVSGSGYVLTVTSPDAGSGKTLTSLNLALTLARGQERRVLLVEGDLWRPRLRQYVHIPRDQPGVFQLLEKRSKLRHAVVTMTMEPGVTLDILNAGGSGQIGDLLSGPRMPELVSRMAAQYEIVILDAPPLVLASGRALSRCADGTLLVIGARKTKKRQVEDALKILGPDKALGLVLNRVRARNVSHTAYLAYTSYYDSDPEPEEPEEPEVPASIERLEAEKPDLDGVEMRNTEVEIAETRDNKVPWRKVGWASAAVALVAATRFVPHGADDTPEASAQLSAKPAPPTVDEPTTTTDPQPDTDADASAVEDAADEVARVDYYTTGRLNLRTGPALTHPVVQTLPQGTALELLGSQGDWRAVRAGDLKGWVTSQWISEAPPEERAPRVAPEEPGADSFVALTNVGVNVRSGPSLEDEILFSLPPETRVRVLGSEGNWYRVRNQGREAWVFSGGVTPAGSASGAVALTNPSGAQGEI